MDAVMHDPLGDRLKSEFEATTQLELPRKTHTIIRLDGKAFHTYTRGLPRPFDETLHADLVAATQFLCEQVTGTLLAYVQSDEVSLLVTDLAKPGTQPWYGGNVQKITSVTASILTAKFNQLRLTFQELYGAREPGNLAFFDSRVFTIPDADDVVDYFHWRYLDAWRNAISSLASTHFSARQLHQKSLGERLDMLREREVDVRALDPRFLFGSVVEPVTREATVTYKDNRTGEARTIQGVLRRSWESRPAPSMAEFLQFGAYVEETLANVHPDSWIHTPQEPVGTVASGSETSSDATPGVATRPGPS
jgi:tRNA(His) 5'-end guanylyltransferase